MTLLEMIRAGLQAPADGGAGGSGSGGTSTTDAGAGAAGDTKDAGAAGATAGAKDGAQGEGEKKSVLKSSAAAGDGAGDGKGATDGTKGQDAKDAGAKAKDGAADAYVVKVPDGVTVDKARLESFTGWAKDKKLTPEQASEAIAFYAAQQKADATAWAKQSDAWYGELEKDGEFGGAKLQESSAALQKALKRFDPKGELVQDLEKYGIDNLPSLARFLRRVGLAGAEDKTAVDTSKETKAVPTENQRLAKRYPSLAKGLAG